MVLQIRFVIWLTLQIEVEALHICKPSHHFASTISVFHIELHPPDVRGHVWTTYAATTRERRWTFPRGDLPSEEDGGGQSRTDANDERGLG